MAAQLPIVKISDNFPWEPILRQTPGGGGIWRGIEFRVNDPACTECDAWVVLDGLDAAETATVRSGRVSLITMEPPLAREYHGRYLAQFDTVLTCQTAIRHPGRILGVQGLPWHAGIDRGVGGDIDGAGRRRLRGYDDLVAMEPAPKKDAISVITSKAGFLPGHVARLRFIEALTTRLKDKVELFGRGVRPIGDKLEALSGYKYHLVLENSRLPHYWTEKLADAYLGHAYPFYSGCTNIGDYFADDVMTTIDIADPTRAIDAIERALAEQAYDRTMDARAAARDDVLGRYNLFSIAADLVEQTPATGSRKVTLTPNPPMSFGYKARRKLRRVVERVR
ncbi:hypothetical protein PQ455_16715 [Sphingomonas naphthae]|uniref:Glycosyltransferase n=1 Tax=Sphingomonas naphthae TaxID=1813468 RepID=A0ABY7TN08_9SPHN|nr:hypothetical protein [Sphingomonas naphthae]WCT73239.1 hypothetical protein PQ455_16715 [Sphingomonas naphthae]